MNSVKSRFSVNFITSVLGMGVGYITTAFATRALGPILYGNFGFLMGVFEPVINFLNLNTSSALFNYNSKYSNDKIIIKWYIKFAVIMLFLLLSFVVISSISNLSVYIFPDQKFIFILLASILAYTNWSQGVIIGYGHSKALTIPVQKIVTIIKFVTTLVFVTLYYLNFLTLVAFFLYQIITVLITESYLVHYYRKNYFYQSQDGNNGTEQIGKYIYTYSSPLFILSIITVGYLVFDRWFLQLIGGANEQGYFTISYKISSICILFTSAMIPIWFREVSQAHGHNDINKMRDIFKKYLRIFYFMTAYIIVIIIFNANLILFLFAGDKFNAAISSVIIMSLYPLHQTYGQMISTFFLATEKTKQFAQISMVIMVVSLPITYFLIAPSDFWIIGGLNLMSAGLAVKFVLVQLLSTNIILFYSCRYLKISFGNFLFHQIYSIGLLVVLMYIVKIIINYILPLNNPEFQLMNILIEVIIYTGIVFILVYIFPAIIGFDKTEILYLRNEIIAEIKQRVSKK